jgi:hypothetical protein
MNQVGAAFPIASGQQRRAQSAISPTSSPVGAAAVREPGPDAAQASPGRTDQDDRDKGGCTQTNDDDQHIHDIHGVPLCSQGSCLYADVPGFLLG